LRLRKIEGDGTFKKQKLKKSDNNSTKTIALQNSTTALRLMKTKGDSMRKSEKLNGRNGVFGVEDKMSSMISIELKRLQKQSAVSNEGKRRYSESSIESPGNPVVLEKVEAPGSQDNLESLVRGSAMIHRNSALSIVRIVSIENQKNTNPVKGSMILEIVTIVMKELLIVGDDTTGIATKTNLIDFTTSVLMYVIGQNVKSVAKKWNDLSLKKKRLLKLLPQKMVNSKMLRINQKN